MLDPNIEYRFKCRECGKIIGEWSRYVKHIKSTKHLGTILLVVDITKGDEL